MKNKIIRRFMGYTVINIKSGKFGDFDRKESEDSYEFWPTISEAKELLDATDFQIGYFNNQSTRKLADKRKYFRIVKLTTVIEVMK